MKKMILYFFLICAAISMYIDSIKKGDLVTILGTVIFVILVLCIFFYKKNKHKQENSISSPVECSSTPLPPTPSKQVSAQNKRTYNEIKSIGLADYCVLDTETTGLNAKVNKIIEICVIRVRNHEIVDTFSTLIKPKSQIGKTATQITGITNEMLKGKPKIEDIETELFDFIGDDVIVGHNISFDVKFIEHAYNRTIDNPILDTLKLSRKQIHGVENYKLETLKRYLNIDIVSHRSEADCYVTHKLYESFRK